MENEYIYLLVEHEQWKMGTMGGLAGGERGKEFC